MKETAIDFGNGNVGTLFKRIFFPTVLGMLSLSAVTVIDGIFVGHGVGSDGIAAVNICIPLLMILTGVGLMVGMGSSVVASIHLSRGKVAAARASVTQAMLTVTLLGAIVLAFIMLFPSQVSRLLGASDHLLPMTKSYLVWFAPSLVFELWLAVAQFALRLDGAPRLAMYCNVVCAVVNTVLDWLFIFPFGWGVMGAAFASSLSCLLGALMAMTYLFRHAHTLRLCTLHLSRNGMTYYLDDIAQQCKVGVSALLGEGTMAVLMFMGNHVFMRYLGDDGVGAFGISCYYLPFVFMIGNSIAQSAQPIISYNFGLGDRERVLSTLHISLLTALACGAVSTVAFVCFPRPLVGLFLGSTANETARIAIAGFPYYGLGFICFIENLAVIGYYQSLKRVRPSTVFALLRGLVFLVPSFLLLPRVAGVAGIWLAMPLSEAATFICICVKYLNHCCRPRRLRKHRHDKNSSFK